MRPRVRPSRRVADPIPLAAALIEFGGALVVAVAVIRALLALAAGRGTEPARLLVIDGALTALGFKTAATLLKAIELGTWRSIATFTAILTLRTVLKQFLLWEQRHIGRVATASVTT